MVAVEPARGAGQAGGGLVVLLPRRRRGRQPVGGVGQVAGGHRDLGHHVEGVDDLGTPARVVPGQAAKQCGPLLADLVCLAEPPARVQRLHHGVQRTADQYRVAGALRGVQRGVDQRRIRDRLLRLVGPRGRRGQVGRGDRVVGRSEAGGVLDKMTQPLVRRFLREVPGEPVRSSATRSNAMRHCWPFSSRRSRSSAMAAAQSRWESRTAGSSPLAVSRSRA